jgi:lysozyme
MSAGEIIVRASRVPVLGRALTAVVGVAVALQLFAAIPAEESGRKVVVAAQPGGAIAAQHVSGREYLTAYADLVGVWTICDGLTGGVKRGQRETRVGCMLRLEAVLVEHSEQVLRCVPTLRGPGREQQLFASVSLSYNIGWPSFCRSTAARRFNARQWRAGCDAFLMWDKAGRPPRVVNGLRLRRQRERSSCLTGVV